jgi:hypothetical protein
MTRAARQLPYQVVHYIAGTYDVDNDTTPKIIGTLPANSLIVSWHVNIVQAFNNAADVELGIAGDADFIATDASIAPASTGSKASAVALPTGSSDLDVKVFTTSQSTDGRLEVAIGFVPATDVFPVI